MSLNPQLVYCPPFEIQLWDKDLNQPLAGGIVTFYEDKNHDIKKPVYQLIGSGEGTYSYVELPNPLTLSGIGTFVDGSGNNLQVYMYPYLGLPTDSPPSQVVDLYYITVVSSTNIPQESVNAWPPGIGAGTSPINEADTTGNIIRNSQFVDVNFDTNATFANPVVISTTGTNTATNIAPGWDIVTTGTGTFSIYQQAIIDTAAPNNPAYALGIATSTGYSSPLKLRQRILAPRIFSGNLVSGTFIAEATDGGADTLTMTYVPSGTGLAQVICSGLTPNTGFITIFNATPVTIISGASGAAPTAYVDITITIPVAAQVQISNIQLAGVSNSTEIVNYLQNTPEEEVNGLFWYFQPQLNFKPIPSLLTAWDFALNPQQFGITSFTTLPKYVWDQTICCSAVGTVNVAQNGYDGSFNATTTNDNEAFYMLQYLSSPEALKTTMSNLSVNINAYLGAHAGVTATVYLFYSTGGGTIPNITTDPIGSIGTIAADGVFTLTATNWAAIPQLYGTNNSGVIPLNNDIDLGFFGWNGRANFDNNNTNNNFAIVVTFAVPISGTIVSVNSISVVPGDIPTRPAPQTFDEVLRECQYYYEKSYNLANPAGSNATIGLRIAPMISNPLPSTDGSSTNAIQNLIVRSWSIQYNTRKRIAPTRAAGSLLIYTPAGTIDNVTGIIVNAGAYSSPSKTGNVAMTNWQEAGNGEISVAFLANNVASALATSGMIVGNFIETYIEYQYVADVRLALF
jgi:hypothetical protein